MKPWLFYSLATLLLWGLWGVFGKLSARSLGSANLMLLSYTGIALVFPIMLSVYAKDYEILWSSRNHLYAILSGLFGGMGFLTFYLALTSGEVSRVVVLTATYPVVTVLIAATFLAEPLTIKTALGTALAIAGVILLSV
ncbi:MAG: EamA family transporter [Gammaproteobacteria bacterium]